MTPLCSDSEEFILDDAEYFNKHINKGPLDDDDDVAIDYNNFMIKLRDFIYPQEEEYGTIEMRLFLLALKFTFHEMESDYAVKN